MPQFNPDILLKNLTKSITDWGKFQGESQKLKSEFQSNIIANELKQRSNWLWKLKQQQMTPEGRGQQWLQQQPMGQVSPFQGYVGRGTGGQKVWIPPSAEAAKLGWARRKKAIGKSIRPMTDEPWSEELDAPLLEGLERKFYGVKEEKEKELTPFQQREVEATQRSVEAWIAGAEPLRDTKGKVITIPPRTQEEAYWGLLSMGQDPTLFDFSHLPLQEEMGEPRPWRKFERKPAIPEQKGAEEYTPEEEQLIKDNMAYYNKTREEIIEALKTKGQLR